jgi:hypothetical protein
MKRWYLATNDECSIILNETNEDAHKKKSFHWSSLSRGYDTKDELIEDKGILNEPCKECGSPIATDFYQPVKSRLINKNLCHSCNFWDEKKDGQDNKRVVIVNGTHYWIEDDKPNAAFQGFGGAKFSIEFNDGRKVITRNLWCQGDIPIRFRDRLPDNAKFIKDYPLIH